MEAAVQQVLSTTPALKSDWREVVFSVSDARRALRYVSAVARDAASAYREAHICRAALQHAASPKDRALLSTQRDEALHRLNLAIDDCNAVGADLLDLAQGKLKFAAEFEGRPVSLIWRVGEPIADAWRAALATEARPAKRRLAHTSSTGSD